MIKYRIIPIEPPGEAVEFVADSYLTQAELEGHVPAPESGKPWENVQIETEELDGE